MPWSNQGGGGPWGSGPKGPWGSGPQSSGPTPPDLEDLLRRSQDKLRSVLPGGNLGSRGFLVIVAVAVLAWLSSGFFTGQPDELGVVTAVRQICAQCDAQSSRPELSSALSDRDGADTKVAERPPDRCRHAHHQDAARAAPSRATCRKKA